ncbi:MAG: SEL1-like repeat protein [Methylococcaceae bacterium]
MILHPHTKIVTLAIAAIVALSLVSCTEKSADNNPAEPPLSAVTEDKITQLQREAQEGNPDAQYNLAYLYENGLGVPKDETRALDLYQQAADQGHPVAQNNLDAMSKK